jgi:hypothetical protein
MDPQSISDQDLDNLLLSSAASDAIAAPSADSISDSDLDKLLSAPTDTEGPATQDNSMISKKQSAARGVAQGATLGFADEISGGVEAVVNKLKGDPEELGRLYKKYRDESRANFDEAQKANPASYTIGEVAGGIGTALVPGLGIAKGAKLAATVGKSALIGAGAGVGYSKSENAGDIAEDAARGAVTAGVLGGAAHAAAPVLSRGVTAAGDKLKGSAQRWAARALGAERGTIKKLGQKEVQEAGRQALEEVNPETGKKILSVFASTDDKIARNEALKKTAMEARKNVYDKIDDAGASSFNPLEVAAQIEKKIIGGKNRSHKDVQELAEVLDPHLENILSRGDGNISMKAAQELVESLKDKAKFDTSRSTTQNKVAKEVYHTVRNAINESAENAAEKVGEKGLKTVVKKSNQTYAAGSTTDKLLKNRQAREQGNNFFGLTDTITGMGSLGYGATTGDWATAGAIVGGKKLAGKYGAQNTALLLNKVGKTLSGSGAKAAQNISKVPAALERIGEKTVGAGVAKKVAEHREKKLKGEEKWASDGVEKLLKHSNDPEQAKLLESMRGASARDPKIRRLLIDASGLKPGSKAMDQILKELTTRQGEDVTNMGVE